MRRLNAEGAESAVSRTDTNAFDRHSQHHIGASSAIHTPEEVTKMPLREDNVVEGGLEDGDLLVERRGLRGS